MNKKKMVYKRPKLFGPSNLQSSDCIDGSGASASFRFCYGDNRPILSITLSFRLVPFLRSSALRAFSSSAS